MTFFQAAPYFFVAILMVALFATKLGWFPQNSGYDTTLLDPGFTSAYITSVLDHARAASADDRGRLGRGLDHRHAQHDADDDGRGLRPASPRPRGSASSG